MRIIDTHHHLWDLSSGNYPWLTGPMVPKTYGDYTAIRRDYLIEHFLEDVDSAGVIRSVHLGAGNAPKKEIVWLQSIADDVSRSRGFPHGIVSMADLLSPTVEADLEWYAGFRSMRGIRQILSGVVTANHADITQAPAWQRAIGLLRKHGMSCDMQVHPSQLMETADLIRRHPDTLFIIDHAGLVNYHDSAQYEIWHKGILAIAALPNTRMKISAFMLYDLKFTADSIRPSIEQMIDAFGVDRCFFASNFPVDGLACSYPELWRRYLSATDQYSADERDRLFYRNGVATYRID